MPLEIEEISNKKQLKAFIRFPMKLYKGNEYYVPPIIDFELSTLLKEKNPAFDYCQARYWMVKKDGKIVGRIAGIIHGTEIKEKKLMRFGWIDFIDDQEVSATLLNTAWEWGQSLGATGIHGPIGFTDLDFEGTLISGYDELATQATIYNFPYYRKHLENWGMTKACDWLEIRGEVPTEVPKRLSRTASIISSRFKLTVKKFRKNKELLKYADGVFQVLNDAYGSLYGYYPLTKKQIDYYVKLYFDFIRREYVSIIVNEQDEVVAFAISLPSLSKAFQKAKGSLYPFGFIHVLKGFSSNHHLDLFLIGVKPEYQKFGANALIFHELLSTYIRKGVKKISTGPMLEDNRRVLNLWNEFKAILGDNEIRRRCYVRRFD